MDISLVQKYILGWDLNYFMGVDSMGIWTIFKSQKCTNYLLYLSFAWTEMEMGYMESNVMVHPVTSKYNSVKSFPNPGLEPGSPAWEAGMMTTYTNSDLADVSDIKSIHKAIICLAETCTTSFSSIFFIRPLRDSNYYQNPMENTKHS